MWPGCQTWSPPPPKPDVPSNLSSQSWASISSPGHTIGPGPKTESQELWGRTVLVSLPPGPLMLSLLNMTSFSVLHVRIPHPSHSRCQTPPSAHILLLRHLRSSKHWDLQELTKLNPRGHPSQGFSRSPRATASPSNHSPTKVRAHLLCARASMCPGVPMVVME